MNAVSDQTMDRIYRNLARCSLAAALLLAPAGCSVAPSKASIQVWAPPRLQSAVGKTVAISPVSGDQRIAGPLQAAMIANAPVDQGRTLRCIDSRSLQGNQTIRLVSAVEGETSDIAILSMARRQGIDYLLTGEIVRQPSAERKAMRLATQPGFDQDAPYTFDSRSALAVSWKLVDVHGKQPDAGVPVVTKQVESTDIQSVAKAAADDAWKLITPYVQKDSATLAATRFTSTSRAVRRGNEAAINGDWMSAQDYWNGVLRANSSHHAALHNLAIAAVARQEYDEANRLIGEALKRKNKALYRETAVWIESRQRDYHLAFGLPDPPTGWAATRR